MHSSVALFERQDKTVKMCRSLLIAVKLLLLAASTTTAFVPTTSIASVRTPIRIFAEEESKSSGNEPRHEVRGGPMPDLSEEETQRLQQQAQAFMEYQQNAPKLDWPSEIRTLVQYNHGKTSHHSSLENTLFFHASFSKIFSFF